MTVSGELRQLEYSQHLSERARNVLAQAPGGSTERTLFEHAHHGSAQALGVPVSGIAVGAPVDLVSLDANHPGLTAHREDGLFDAWIFPANRTMVNCVWRRRVKLVEKGHHHLRDATEAHYKQFIKRILQ